MTRRTVGASAFNSHLRDMISKHAPDRSWGSLATVQRQQDGTLGLLIDGDPGPYLEGQWFWLMPLTLTRVSFETSTSAWYTQPGGGDGHTHQLVLPEDLWQALRPPGNGDRVWVTWLDPGNQAPLVTGIVRAMVGVPA
jgi:hypothetical protein